MPTHTKPLSTHTPSEPPTSPTTSPQYSRPSATISYRLNPKTATSPAPPSTTTADGRRRASTWMRPFLTLQHFTLPRWFAQPAVGSTRSGARFSDTSSDRPVLDAGAHTSAPSTNPTSSRCSPPTAGMECLRCATVFPSPIRVDPVSSSHHATRVQIKSRTRNRRWMGCFGAGLSSRTGPNICSTLHPVRDEVFLEASTHDDWVGVQTYTRIRIGVGPDAQPVESTTPRRGER